MKTIEERAAEHAPQRNKYGNLISNKRNNPCKYRKESLYRREQKQKVIDIDTACNIFCYTGCPHKTDSYNCLNNKCDTWKIFRRMMEESA